MIIKCLRQEGLKVQKVFLISFLMSAHASEHPQGCDGYRRFRLYGLRFRIILKGIEGLGFRSLGLIGVRAYRVQGFGV